MTGVVDVNPWYSVLALRSLRRGGGGKKRHWEEVGLGREVGKRGWEEEEERLGRRVGI